MCALAECIAGPKRIAGPASKPPIVYLSQTHYRLLAALRVLDDFSLRVFPQNHPCDVDLAIRVASIYSRDEERPKVHLEKRVLRICQFRSRQLSAITGYRHNRIQTIVEPRLADDFNRAGFTGTPPQSVRPDCCRRSCTAAYRRSDRGMTG